MGEFAGKACEVLLRRDVQGSENKLENDSTSLPPSSAHSPLLFPLQPSVHVPAIEIELSLARKGEWYSKMVRDMNSDYVYAGQKYE